MKGKIENEICHAIFELFGIKENVIKLNISKSLLGKPFYLQAEELLYLFFYLEDKYNLRLEKRNLLDYKFSSIQNITKLIEEYSL